MKERLPTIRAASPTCSHIGAQCGFTMLWTLVFSCPLMAAIQEASAWIDACHGHEPASSVWRITDFDTNQQFATHRFEIVVKEG
jgi:hypothetical protein